MNPIHCPTIGKVYLDPLALCGYPRVQTDKEDNVGF